MCNTSQMFPSLFLRSIACLRVACIHDRSAHFAICLDFLCPREVSLIGEAPLANLLSFWLVEDVRDGLEASEVHGGCLGPKEVDIAHHTLRGLVKSLKELKMI